MFIALSQTNRKVKAHDMTSAGRRRALWKVLKVYYTLRINSISSTLTRHPVIRRLVFVTEMFLRVLTSIIEELIY